MAALACPSCGAPHHPENPGILVIACGACGSTLYREGDLLRAGEVARLEEPRSRLRVGATGQVGHHRVRLIGRVGFRHDDGRWDEWYATDLDTHDPLWVVEDERRYTVERQVPAPPGAALLHEVGALLEVQGVTYDVREVGQATCEGAEGQLPRPVHPGEGFRYVDLAEVHGRRRLLLEVGDQGGVDAFLGEPVDAGTVRFDGEAAGPVDGRERPREGRTCRCPGCGAPAEIPVQGEPVRTLACAHCDQVFAPEGEVGRFLGRRVAGRDPGFTLEVGDRGALDGVRWEVVGRLHYQDEEAWPTWEFLLWSPAGGYLWLEESGGHFCTLRPARSSPSVRELRALAPRRTARFDGTSFTCAEVGVVRLEHVDGALPWEARIGDRNRYVDLFHGRQVASVELSDDEAECFVGTWRPADQVLGAFGRRGRARRQQRHPAQPNPFQGWLGVVAVSVVAALANLVLALVVGASGQEVFAASLPDGVGVTGQDDVAVALDEWISPPFTLDPAGGVVSGLHIQSPVDNSWAWVGVELVDAAEADEDEAVPVGMLSSEVEYYHGVEDGEGWSEGSRVANTWFRTPEAGAYVLRVSSEGGSRAPVTVRITQGARLTRFLWLNAGLAGVVVMVLAGGFLMFEHARVESDDEDDE